MRPGRRANAAIRGGIFVLSSMKWRVLPATLRSTHSGTASTCQHVCMLTFLSVGPLVSERFPSLRARGATRLFVGDREKRGGGRLRIVIAVDPVTHATAPGCAPARSAAPWVRYRYFAPPVRASGAARPTAGACWGASSSCPGARAPCARGGHRQQQRQEDRKAALSHRLWLSDCACPARAFRADYGRYPLGPQIGRAVWALDPLRLAPLASAVERRSGGFLLPDVDPEIVGYVI